MPRIQYVAKRFSASSLAIVEQANAICTEYAAQGFDLTLRQLYYQFVSRAIIPNRDTEYKRLGSIINDARLAGLLDWNYIVDRTRNLRANPHWTDPADIIEASARSFRIDKWAMQPYRPEVWIEKDALIGVIQGVCAANDVPYFSCRGYTSQSEVWSAAQRLNRYRRQRKEPIILHLGDHDPSGIDMTRDITDRLTLFMGGVPVQRLALNWDQVEQYNPPPNPTKLTDSRATGYLDRFGESSWELDALEPTVLAALIQDALDGIKDLDLWDAALADEERGRAALRVAATHWDVVTEFLADEPEEDA